MYEARDIGCRADRGHAYLAAGTGHDILSFFEPACGQGDGVQWCTGVLRDLVWRKSRLQQAPGFCRRHQVLKILLPYEVTWVVGLRCFCVWAIAII